ncbi:MAG: TIM barrel protein [Acidobacteria bacterium]|nr:TIM barrel protein [Acidobacteriota bacterium]
MTRPRIANAPCSWGTLEFEGLEGERYGYEQMLDELADTGYVGTELGDWGFMPTEPSALRYALEKRRLAMVGAFVPVALKHREQHEAGVADALRYAMLLASVAETGPGAWSPVVVLADNNGGDPVRTANAGRVTEAMGLSDAEWTVFADGAERVARTVRAETGLRTVFHHHCAGYVETPAEVDRLMARTDPSLLGLVFDTGHYLYGSGGTDPGVVDAGLDRLGDRIWHVHFKDCDPEIARQARRDGWDYFAAVRRGLFCELGRGNVDFPAVKAWLGRRAFSGWIVVEQDVLPGMGAPAESARRNRQYLRTIGL